MPRPRRSTIASPQLFGRQREMVMLRSCLDEMLSGHGRLVLVSGEAGIGKTSLVLSITLPASAEGARVLTSSCYDLTRTPPYGPWVELFSSVESDEAPPSLPIVDDMPESHPASPDALFSEALDYLERLAATQPLVVVLEDMHWSDHASLDFLRYVARHLNDMSMLVIVTFRDTELERGHPLNQMMPALVRETQAARVRLQPLDESAVSEWIDERYGLTSDNQARVVRYLQRRAEGNPFFIDECLRTLEEERIVTSTDRGWQVSDLDRMPVPQLVRQLIDGRLTRLSATSRHLLEVASVIGHDVPLDVWRSAAAVSDPDLSSAITQATDLHLLEESPRSATLRFTHALIREALYYGLELPHRQAVHHTVGTSLASMPSADPDAVAFHLLEAGDRDAREWLMAAGERAQQLYAWRVAAERFEAVLPLIEADRASLVTKGWLLYRIGLLLVYADAVRGTEFLGDAERIAAQVDDRHLLAYSMASQGLLRCLTGDVRRGLPEMQSGVEALDLLPPIQEPAWTADERSLLTVANIQRGVFDLIGLSPEVNIQRGGLIFWLAWAGRYAEVIEIGEPYVTELAEADGQMHDALGDALAGLGHAYAALGRPDESLEAFARARETYQRIDHHFKVGNTAIYELSEAYLPYRTENIHERQWLAEQAEAG